MRVGLLGDIHANLPALEAVLEHARKRRVAEFWCVGDLLGYGAFPDQVVQSLQQNSVLCIAGNYDLKVLQVPEKRSQWRHRPFLTDGKMGYLKMPQKWLAFRWAYDHLAPEGLDYVRSLPKELRLEAQGRRFLLVHGSPVSSEEPLGPDTPAVRLRELAKSAGADVVISGHSHVPSVRAAGGVRFINTGSVGRPDDGDPRACYAILSVAARRVQVRHYRLSYDVERAAAAIRACALPEEFAQMVLQGRSLDAIVESRSEPAGTGLDSGQAQDSSSSGDASNVGHDLREGPADDATLQSVLELARLCEYEEQHTHQVTRLALRLFDELRIIHGLGPTERAWLQYAALLHDIGLLEGAQGHHKASLRIILDAPLLPFDKTERLIIGSVARYHRAALPRESHGHFAKLKPAARRVVRILAGVLRVADGLDYTHQSVVEELVCNVSPTEVLVDCLVAVCSSPSDPLPAEAERQRALEKGQLLEEVLERKLVIGCSPR